IAFVVEYGATFLEATERAERLTQLLSTYYEFLADRAIHFANATFWRYHRERMAELGLPIRWGRLTGVVSKKLVRLMLSPTETGQKVLRRLGKTSNAE